MKAEKELTFRLTVGDLDQYDRITPYAISNLFQEIAALHAEELGVGYEVMNNKNLAWIIARNKIDIINHNNITKIVKVHTWPHPNGRFDFERDYLLYNENNELIAKGTSKWLVYDLKRNFLCSSKGIMEDIDFKEDKLYEEKFDKIVYGDINEFKKIYEYKISYLDLDHYGHMNNAKYLNVMMNALNLSNVDNIYQLQIDYINQGYFNEVIDVYKKEEQDFTYLIGKNLDKIIFAIKIKLMPKQ